MAVTRWIFSDGVVPDWTVPINPDTMAPLHAPKSLSTFGNATLKAPDVGLEWSFGGVIRSETHYNLLETWTAKSIPVTITDHFGREIRCILVKFDPVDRTPTPGTPWRLRYTVEALVLGVTEV